MNIGLIGYGKMGRDIFALLFDKLADADITVLEIYGAEENTAAVIKTLDKGLRRKKLTQEQYDRKLGAFRFTDKAEDLKDCDLVIEAIFEDIGVKRSAFSRVADVVSDKCLLLTNTSSLSIPEIFENIPHKERCFGLHFFYPVKLSGFTELNILPENTAENIETARRLVSDCGKKPIVFTGKYHIYLNQILSCMVAHAIYLLDTLDVSVSELQAQFSELYPVADAFEVLDSIGLGLMSGDPDNFRISRNEGLLRYSCDKMNKWIAEGCPKEPGSFLGFIGERISDTGNNCDNAALSMTALILNETVNALEESTENSPELLCEAVQDTLGIAESPAHYYNKYGAEALFAELDRLSAVSGFGSYQHKEKAVWDKYFL